VYLKNKTARIELKTVQCNFMEIFAKKARGMVLWEMCLSGTGNWKKLYLKEY